MGEFLDDDTVFRSFTDRRLEAESRATGYGSMLLLVVVGLYTCLKALEFLGYPAGFWYYIALAKLKELSSSGVPTDEDTKMSSGNMLSRTFGLNSASLLQKGVRGVAGALSKAPSDVPPGLGNWDNSCFQNSVIQGMASLPSLREYLSKATAKYHNLDPGTTNGALFDMVTKLNDPSSHGQNFWIRGKLKSMNTFDQQDAQEYYSKILDALDNEVQAEVKKRRPSEAWADAAKAAAESLESSPEKGTSKEEASSEDSTGKATGMPESLSNPLDGLLAQRVGCVQCGYVEGIQLIPFNCVTVALGRNSAYDIRECLDDYTTLEHIEGVECAKCTLLKNKEALARLAGESPALYSDRLKAVEDALENDDFDDKTLVRNFKILKKNWAQSTKSRQAVIARAPKALVLHVNRSIFDEMTGAMYKNSANVSYPRVLDLGTWCLGSDIAGGEWPRDPKKSMLGDANAESLTNSPFQYRLRAAVTHYGSHGNGHYVCYRPHTKTPISKAETDEEEVEVTGEQWWRFSDESVYPIREADAHQGNIFMLFYERIDGDAPVPNEVAEKAQQAIATENDIPLPPSNVVAPQALTDDAAVTIPLPDDDDLLDEEPAKLMVEQSLPTPRKEAPRPENADDTSTVVAEPVAQPISSPSTKASDPDTSAHPTSSPESPSTTTFDDTEMSETGSEGVPSMLLTSDDDAGSPVSKSHPQVSPSPHLMRTAGASTSRDRGNRKSLPMVTAT